MSGPTPDDVAPGAAVLRAEHDALARRLEIRRSIDAAKVALQHLFVGLLCVGLTVKLAWDRWGVPKPGVVRTIHPGPPLFFIVAAIAAIVILLLAIRSFVRARRLGREEDRLFARFQQLRAKLGLDP
jgi:hypothetical protein